MLKLSKDESLGERETCGQSRCHRLCSCDVFLGIRHLGIGGCLDFCRRLGTVRSRLGTGFSLVGASGPVFTVVDDKC